MAEIQSKGPTPVLNHKVNHKGRISRLKKDRGDTSLMAYKIVLSYTQVNAGSLHLYRFQIADSPLAVGVSEYDQLASLAAFDPLDLLSVVCQGHVDLSGFQDLRSAEVSAKRTSAGTDDCNSCVKMICYRIIKKKGA